MCFGLSRRNKRRTVTSRRRPVFKAIDWKIVWALARRTFRKSVESPIAYLVAFFFYGFVGIFFGISFFVSNQASVERIGDISSWIFCLIIPGLTMGLISDEISSGTFEQLSTLPVRDEEIVLGKFIGFAI